MIQKVFKRVEQKYLLTKEKYTLLQDYLNKYFKRDKFYDSKIYNIYLDNDNNDLIINSIEKPIYKQKFRVRSYGVPKNNDYVFLEMKTKFKGTVYKRRVKLTLKEYDDYINKGILPNTDKQIMNEIDYYINYYKLKPKFLVAYDRLSYYCKDDKNFRITFDTNLRSRNDNLSLSDHENNKFYFSKPMYIMEIKSLSGLPLWFTKLLSSYQIYPSSFSKVGNIYRKGCEKIC